MPMPSLFDAKLETLLVAKPVSTLVLTHFTDDTQSQHLAIFSTAMVDCLPAVWWPFAGRSLHWAGHTRGKS